MVKNKGFTLIELLAVIVILAIIALIAVPIVLNIIDDTREESNKRSVEMYGKAIQNSIARHQLNGGDSVSGKFTSNGKTITNGIITLDIDYDNAEVICSTIEIFGNGNIYLDNCKVNNQNVDYVYGADKYETETLSKTLIFNPIQSKTLKNYRIYGNSEGLGEVSDNGYIIPVEVKGKNLFNSAIISDGIIAGSISPSYKRFDMRLNSGTYTITFSKEIYKQSSNITTFASGAQDFTTNTFVITETKDISFQFRGSNKYGEDKQTSEFYNSLKIQIEEGNISTEYEPYVEPVKFNIVLTNPLMEDEYIDFETQKVMKSDGTVKENITLPSITTLSVPTTIIEVGTTRVPSKIEAIILK